MAPVAAVAFQAPVLWSSPAQRAAPAGAPSPRGFGAAGAPSSRLGPALAVALGAARKAGR